MRIICIDCHFNYALWENEVAAISHNDAQKLNLLSREIINGDKRTIVLYSLSSMEFEYGDFLDQIRDSAILIPVGESAVALGLGNAAPEQIAQVNQYVLFGRDANIIELEKYLAHIAGEDSGETPAPPKPTAFDGIFRFDDDVVYSSLEEYLDAEKPPFERYVAIFTHRHAWVNGNLATIRALCDAVERQGIGAIPVFSTADGKSSDFARLADKYFYRDGKVFIQALVSMSMFAVMAKDGRTVSEQSVLEFTRLGVPVFSPVQSYYISESAWRAGNNPLAEDMPSSLIMPETYGMIEPVMLGVLGREGKSAPIPERAEHAARRIAAWVRLRTKANREKKVALMLHNSVCSGVEATLGRAFGLDALESAVRILRRLSEEGYHITDIPENGAALLDLIMTRKAISDFRWTSAEDILGHGGCVYEMPVPGEYDRYYAELPQACRADMERTWGEPPGEGMVSPGGKLVITGVLFGNALVMIQPKRGCYGAKCTGEVCKILHDPSCPPPHQYLATYRYLRDVFKADAVVDIGTDGSAEYLPGKVSGLSETCWPSIVLDNLPSLYIYNAGVVSEGMLAKRRLNAVTVDYLPPASMGVDEKSAALSRKIDEYQNALGLDSGHATSLKGDILPLLDEIPAAKRMLGDDFDSSLSDIREVIRRADSARQISTGPHIFGQIPSGEEQRRFVREIWQSEGLDDSTPLSGPDFDGLSVGLQATGLEMDNLIRGLNGAYIPAGESGMPDENGRNIIPTGRNMFGMQIDKVPTKAAWERGVVLAKQLLERYVGDEGRLPEQVAMNMISLDVTRGGGEQLSQFLFLLGVRPVWDRQNRVTGLEVITTEELGRPRIDVTVRISGVLRDTWPSAVMIMDEAVLLVTSLDEDDAQNFPAKHVREFRAGFDAEPEDTRRAVRIFGDPPGAYGAGLDLALLASAWKDEDDLVKYFTQSSAFAYGKGLDGARKVREFIDTARKVEVTTDVTQSRRMNALACGFGVQVQGGYRLLAKRLGGRAIRQYQSVSEAGSAPVTHTLDESIRRTAEDTVLNEFWRDSVRSRGYDGAADIMHCLQNVFSAQIVIGCFSDEFLDRIARETVNNDELREWLEQANPYALEEIGRRLLELQSRGKWNPDADVLERLRQNYLLIEGDMEGRLEPAGEIQGGNVDIINHEGNALWEAQLRDIEAELRKGFPA